MPVGLVQSAVMALRQLLSPKSHLQEVTAAGCLSAQLQGYSRGVG